MPHAPASSLSSPSDSFDIELALKQFSLESARLEMAYRNLQEKFENNQQAIEDFRTGLCGKLSELDFTSLYLSAILDHISQGILFIDTSGVVTTYNKAAEQILTLQEKQLLYRPFGDFFADDCFGFSLSESLASRRLPPPQLITWKREGQSLDVEIEATFVAMSSASSSLSSSLSPLPCVQGILILMRDVTKMLRLQRLAHHQDRLKSLGELAAHLAHEIRNPLGGIKGFAALLEQELKEQPDLQKMASYILQGADGLSRFVSNVLLYARPFQLHLESTDVIQLVEETLKLVEVDSSWNSLIHVVFSHPSEPILLSLDPFLFKSALLNLLINASQAMPKGGSIHVRLEKDKAEIRLYIEDNGLGIAPEHLPKIFSPFFTTKESGNGLGLAEVHKVVQEHQGTIEVQSQLGVGTCFTIKIPVIF